MPFLALAFLTGIAFVMRGATLPSVLTLSGLALAAAAAEDEQWVMEQYDQAPVA